ncbi:MAG: GAD domain-containing protein [Candidatus Thermoplasmatota archaeon]
MKELTEIFSNTNSKFIKNIVAQGGVVLGTKIENFYGVLVTDKAYADSLAKKLESQLGIKGFVSTDELPKYGISREEKENVERALELAPNDVGVFVVDKKEKAEKAIELILEEVKGYQKSS